MLTCKAWSKLFHWLIEYLKTSMYVHFEFWSFHANSGVKTSSACVLINILSNLEDKHIAFLGLYEISVYIYYQFLFLKRFSSISRRLKKHNILCGILNLDCIVWQLATTLVKLLSYPLWIILCLLLLCCRVFKL